MIKDEKDRIKYIDDSTDDEGIMSVREKLLPKKSPNLSNVVEETPPPTPVASPSGKDLSSAANGNHYKHTNGNSPGAQNRTTSTSSKGSLTKEMTATLASKMEDKKPIPTTPENVQC